MYTCVDIHVYAHLNTQVDKDVCTLVYSHVYAHLDTHVGAQVYALVCRHVYARVDTHVETCDTNVDAHADTYASLSIDMSIHVYCHIFTPTRRSYCIEEDVACHPVERSCHSRDRRCWQPCARPCMPMCHHFWPLATLAAAAPDGVTSAYEPTAALTQEKSSTADGASGLCVVCVHRSVLPCAAVRCMRTRMRHVRQRRRRRRRAQPSTPPCRVPLIHVSMRCMRRVRCQRACTCAHACTRACIHIAEDQQ